jgi:hypothetical protein
LLLSLFFSATLFAKSKNVMLSHLYADVIEEEGSGKAGAKKKGGSLQTISAAHRVRIVSLFVDAHCCSSLVDRNRYIN